LFVPSGHSPIPQTLAMAPQPQRPPTLEPQSEMSRQFLATEATLFLSGGSSDSLQPRKVQWSDQQQPRLTCAPPVTTPVKPPVRNVEAEAPRTPAMSDTVRSYAPVTPVTSETGRGQTPVTPVQARASLTSLATSDKASPGLHPDILAVLSWQNEQLTALQDQVARLLEASPASRARASLGNITRDAQTSVLHDQGQETPVRRDMGGGGLTQSVSTNTSTRWPVTEPAEMTYSRDIHGGEMDIESCLGRREVMMGNSVVTEARAPPAPESVTSPAPSERRALDNIASPVLGESVSMYEREGEASEDMRLYENILDRVQRLLATGEAKEVTPEADKEQEEEVTTQADPQAATWDRLRQLGVSFISPGDLGTVSAASGQDTLWLPRARLPASNAHAQPRLSPDASLAMNDLALKYLTDNELGKLAAVHQPKEKKEDARGQVDFSLASHQFLAKYGHQQLQKQQQQKQPPTTRNILPPPGVGEPKRTPSPYAPGQYQTIPEEPQPPRLTNQILNGPQFQRILDISAIRQQSKLL